MITAALSRPSDLGLPFASWTADSGDLERSIRSIMNTESGVHEHLLAWA